jgi:hypothetical protein
MNNMIIVLKSRNIELDYPTKKKVPNQLSTNARKKFEYNVGLYYIFSENGKQ